MNKLFLYIFTWRRNFRHLFPLLFLSYSGNTIEQFGFLMVAWTLWSLVMEIPSGYISDRLWYRKTLIFGKVAMVFSTLFLIIWETFRTFAVANFLFTTALAFKSWTLQAYVHDLLETKWIWNQYWKFMSKLRGNVSLLSVWFIIGFPFLFAIDPLYPFYFALCIDVIGLGASLLLVQPKKASHLWDEKKASESIVSLLGVFFRSKKFLVISCIVAISWTIFLSSISFKEPYLISVWYPIARIWLVMWGSRFVAFVFWRLTKYIKKDPTIKNLIISDLILLGWWFVVVSIFWQSWIVTAVLFIFMIGYYYTRMSFYTQQLFAVLPNQNYKATFLSIKAQLEWLLGLVFPIIMAYCMAIGYDFWFLVAGVLYGVVGVVWLTLVRRYKI